MRSTVDNGNLVSVHPLDGISVRVVTGKRRFGQSVLGRSRKNQACRFYGWDGRILRNVVLFCTGNTGEKCNGRKGRNFLELFHLRALLLTEIAIVVRIVRYLNIFCGPGTLAERDRDLTEEFFALRHKILLFHGLGLFLKDKNKPPRPKEAFHVQ